MISEKVAISPQKQVIPGSLMLSIAWPSKITSRTTAEAACIRRELQVIEKDLLFALS